MIDNKVITIHKVKTIYKVKTKYKARLSQANSRVPLSLRGFNKRKENKCQDEN